MAEVRESRLFSLGYVYYESLNDPNSSDAQKVLYQNAKGVFDKLGSEKSYGNVSNSLKRMAQAELTKEIALLNKVFDKEIFAPADLGQKDFVKELTQTLNYALGVKRVYEATKGKIMHDRSSVSIAPFIIKYMNDAFQELVGELAEGIAGKIYQISSPSELEDKIDSVIHKMIKRGIDLMFSANYTANTPELKEFSDAYYDLIAQGETYKAKGRFAEKLYQYYEFESMKEDLEILLRDVFGGKAASKMNLPKYAELNARKFQLGGLTQEALAEFLLEVSVKSFKNASGESITYKTEILPMGKRNMKTDTLISFGVDMDRIVEVLDEQKGVAREKSIATFKKLDKKLSGLRDGFIVHSNVKTSNAKYKDLNNMGVEELDEKKGFKGFSSGTEMDLVKYANVLDGVGGGQQGSATFITAIMNTLKGAVGGNNKSMETLRNLIAADISYFLYDDLDNIGRSLQASSGPAAIHVFNLKGIYVPLSVFLFQLADAISVGEGSKGLVRVTISRNPVAIKYPVDTHRGPYTQEHWKDQAAEAMTAVKISARFLRNFNAFMQGIM